MKRIPLFCALCACSLLAGCFDFSPDGTQIAVSNVLASSGSARDAAASIVGTSDGVLQALPDAKGGYGPKWSPDGRSILFRKKSDQPHGKQPFTNELWQVDLASKTSWRVQGDFQHTLDFSWRDDSRQWVGWDNGEQEQRSVFWFDSQTQKVVRRVVLPLGLYLKGQFQFLSNSQEIVFQAEGHGGTNLFRTRKTGVERLTTTGDVRAFRLLPSLRLVWARTPNFKRSNQMSLFGASLGSRLVQVARMPFSSAPVEADPVRDWNTGFQIAISPDARQLALCDTFRSPWLDAKKQPQQFGMCLLMNADGTNRRELHRTQLHPTPLGRDQQEWGGGPTELSAQWSRDGQRLALLDEHQNPRRFFVFNVRGDLVANVALPLVKAQPTP
jgi:dipeptidyl aminopeptidase/acylaminoacyl peptidase